MHAEIISIGSELTTGAKLDTNSQWLSVELAAIGIPVQFHTTVADNRAANLAVLKNAVERADVVLITGGLGPTLDDLTREVLAELIGVELILHEPSLQIIREMFARRKREMPERNVVQAMFPAGSEVIPNPRGTAPGVWMDVPRGNQEPCRIAAMPGVPSEMKGMFTEWVLPRLRTGHADALIIRRARINCFGLGESHAEELLKDLTARGRDPEVGITVHEATITLRIEAHGQSVAECEAKIAEARRIARERLGTAVFGEEDEELQDVIVRMLNAHGATLATAEVGTGGLMANRLTDASGSESCYCGGIVSVNGRALDQLIPLEHPLPAGAIRTREAAADMAVGCRRRFGTDFALSITECPATRDERDPVPVAFLALAAENFVDVRELTLGGDPAILKSRVVKSVLNLLRLHLLKSDPAR